MQSFCIDKTWFLKCSVMFAALCSIMAEPFHSSNGWLVFLLIQVPNWSICIRRAEITLWCLTVCVCVSVCALLCVCLMQWEKPLDIGFLILLVYLWYVRKQPQDIWQIILICSYTITTTNPTVRHGILNNLFTDSGGYKVTLVKQLSLVETLPLVKWWKWNHKLEVIS